MMLRKFNVTVRRFDPAKAMDETTAETFVLPVDSPDEEHAASAAMSNAVAFTPKVQGGKVVPVGFCATEVSERQ